MKSMKTSASVSHLETHLGYWLRYVSNHVSHAFSRKLSGLDVTVSEWVLLREMHGDAPRMPSELADRLGLTRGAISKLAERLSAKNLVTRIPHGSDHRSYSLKLTRRGCGLVPKLAALADQNDAEFFGNLVPADRVVIETAMRDIVHRLGLRSVPID